MLDVEKKPRIRRLQIETCYRNLEDLVSALSRGEPLKDAASRASVGLSEKVRQKLATAKLGLVITDRRAPRRNETPDFVAAPWRLLPSRESFADGLQSPVGDAPSMRCALVRLNKASVLPEEQDQTMKALARLQTETGLLFVPGPGRRGIDLSRLGDLELLSVKDDPAPQHAVTVLPASEAIEVRANTKHDQTYHQLFVRCRQTHAGAILEDRMAPLVPTTQDGDTRPARFPLSPLGVSGADIEVWASDSGDSPLRLVYAHELARIRQVRIAGELMEGQFSLESSWLERWAAQRPKTKGNADRVDKMRAVRRRATGFISHVGEPDELWASAERNARDLALAIAPPSSGGLWIGKDEGKMRVAEWFRDTLTNAQGSASLLIVDPYFDDFGLDLIARIGPTDHSIEVITTSRPTRSEQDKDPETCVDKQDEPRQGRADRLFQIYENNRAIFEGIKLSIHIVSHKELHDRYVLELGHVSSHEHLARCGFHLSNSLQRATENHPLLITPIPTDILPEVADSVSEMLSGSRRLVSPRMRARHPTTPQRERPTDEERRGAEDALVAAAIEDDKEVFASALTTLSELLQFVPGDFCNFAYELAERMEPNEAVIASVMRELGSMRLTTGSQNDNVLELANLFALSAKPFAEIQDPARAWTHGRWSSFQHPSAKFGIWLLFHCSPENSATIWSDWCTPPAEEDVSREARLEHGRRIHLLFEVLQRAGFCAQHHESWAKCLLLALERGLRASSPFLRAYLAALLGWQHGLDRSADRTVQLESERCREVLRHLDSPFERALAIADWVSQLRFADDRNGHVEPDGVAALRKRYLSWMVEDWPPGLDATNLRLIIDRCEGAGRSGAWADTTINDLLLPAVKSGRLSVELLLDYWLGQLEERLAHLAEDKYHFYAAADIPLSHVCAQLFAIEEDEDFAIDTGARGLVAQRIQLSLDRLNEIANTARYVRGRPFVRSLDYNRWKSAQDVLHWIGAFALSIRKHEKVPDNVRDQVEDWTRDLEPASPQTEPTGLAAWLQQLLDEQ